MDQDHFADNNLRSDADFSLKQVLLFLRATQCNTLKELALSLNMSPTSVSRSLADLDHSVGATLLNRERGLSMLTEAGQAFLPHAKRMHECLMAIGYAMRLQSGETVLPQELIQNQNPTLIAEKLALRITIEQLNTFVNVAQSGGFSSAARLGEHTQSHLSRQVRDLEYALSAELLERKPSGINSTPAGQSLLPMAKSLLQLHAQAGNCMRLWRTSSNLQLVIMGSLDVTPRIMPVLLKQLQIEFQQHEVEVRNELSHRVEQSVLNGSALLGLCGVFHENPNLVYTHLLKIPLGLAWSSNMQVPLCPRSLEELAHIPIVRLDNNNRITQAMIEHQVHFPNYFESPVVVNNVDSGIELVHTGEYAMFMSGLAASRRIAHDLQFRPLPGLLPSLRLSIIKRRDSPFDERRERLLEVLADTVVKAQWHESVERIRWPMLRS